MRRTARAPEDGQEERDYHTYPPHLPRRLRPCGERRGEEAEGDSANEGAAIHYSIT